jgi:hypothetical protein
MFLLVVTEVVEDSLYRKYNSDLVQQLEKMLESAGESGAEPMFPEYVNKWAARLHRQLKACRPLALHEALHGSCIAGIGEVGPHLAARPLFPALETIPLAMAANRLHTAAAARASSTSIIGNL